MTREEAIKALIKERKTSLHENKQAFDMAIEALINQPRFIIHSDGTIEQIIEPCEDCINRNKVLEGKVIHQSCDGVEIINSYAVPVEYIEHLPSIQPKPKTGHWKKLNVGYGCSECSLATNKSGRDFYRFCPNCGAKMESEE